MLLRVMAGKMYLSVLSGVLFFICLMCGVQAAVPDPPGAGSGQPDRPRVVEHFANLPLSFIENRGQLDPKIKYYEQGNRHNTYLGDDGIYLELFGREKTIGDSSVSAVSETFRLFPLHGNESPGITASDMQQGKINYFTGKNPRDWKTGIPAYRTVLYRDIYPGIDLKVYGKNRRMEYDIIVAPGKDPSRVRMGCQGIQGLEKTKTGGLAISMKAGALIQEAPYCFQEIDGRKVRVACDFKIIGEMQTASPGPDSPALFAYAFDIGAYDKGYPLIIDPVVTYSTYLGNYGRGYGIDADDQGNAYITGSHAGTTFLPMAGYKTGLAPGDRFDGFVVKLSSDGTELVYATYLGGDSGAYDTPRSIRVDKDGCAYITGDTNSHDFPVTAGCAQPKNGRDGDLYSGQYDTDFADAFVTKLGPSGDSLVYSTFLGGYLRDQAWNIDVDDQGHAYITGTTQSLDFPVQNGFQPGYNGHTHPSELYGDAFLTKLSPDGTTFLYSTYFGGARDERGYGVAAGNNGNAYITGHTNSTDLSVRNAFQENFNRLYDGFAARFDTTAAGDQSMVYATYLGGNGYDEGHDIDVDPDGNAVVVGLANTGQGFPVMNPLPVTGGGFAAKLAADGNALIWSTPLQGSRATALELDSNGNACITGQVYYTAADLDMVDPVQPAFGGGSLDIYVMKLKGDGSEVLFLSYLGGSNMDTQYSHDVIAMDGTGTIFVTGITKSLDYPVTPGVYQPYLSGTMNPFVTKITFGNPPAADAGDDVVIQGIDQFNTVLQGTADDPDDDPLTYRWTAQGTALSAWQALGDNGAAPLDLGELSGFSVGTHPLTLEVDDGTTVSTDEMVLTVANSAPMAAASGQGVYELSTDIVLGGAVSDYEGDALDYEWVSQGTVLFSGRVFPAAGGAPLLLPDHILSGLDVGDHLLTLRVNDGTHAPVETDIMLTMVDTTAPTLSLAVDPVALWPPNNKMKAVTIITDAQDNSGQIITLSATVESNEPVGGKPDWSDPAVDPASGVISLQLRAKRDGKGSGRIYTILVTATDGSGNAASESIEVLVPHDKGKK